MKKLALIITINLICTSVLKADFEEMTDREVLSLFSSTQGEETALRSILPKEQFKLKILVKDIYSIVDKESPEVQIPGLQSIHKYSVEGCMRKSKSTDGVCLGIWLYDSEDNRKKLRSLKNTDSTPEFLVGLWSITDLNHEGGKFKVINFAEKKSL